MVMGAKQENKEVVTHQENPSHKEVEEASDERFQWMEMKDIIVSRELGENLYPS